MRMNTCSARTAPGLLAAQEMERIQGMVNLAADLLRDAMSEKQRECLRRQLSYYLRRKRELEAAALSSQHEP
jgi:hypothetical protein